MDKIFDFNARLFDVLSDHNMPRLKRQQIPLTESNFNDVKQIMKIINDNSDDFVTFRLLNENLIKYVIRYVTKVHGMKFNVPGRR